MNEDFVSFSIAKKLKEKGYTLDTAHHYDDNGGIVVSLVEFDERCVYPCPEIHQVLKWLREEKRIHIGFGYSPRKKWRHVVMYMDDRFYNKPTLTVDGFLKIEQAALAGIEYVIDNLI